MKRSAFNAVQRVHEKQIRQDSEHRTQEYPRKAKYQRNSKQQLVVDPVFRTNQLYQLTRSNNNNTNNFSSPETRRWWFCCVVRWSAQSVLLLSKLTKSFGLMCQAWPDLSRPELREKTRHKRSRWCPLCCVVQEESTEHDTERKQRRTALSYLSLVSLELTAAPFADSWNRSSRSSAPSSAF